MYSSLCNLKKECGHILLQLFGLYVCTSYAVSSDSTVPEDTGINPDLLMLLKLHSFYWQTDDLDYRLDRKISLSSLH